MEDETTVLITGGTGYLGRHLTEHYIDYNEIDKIKIFSRDDHKQQAMKQDINRDDKLEFIIGDVRDKQALDIAMKDVDIVIHTAALKKIYTMELNPLESIKTNLLGWQNVAETSINRGVQKVVGISTDKACQPINIYGICKAAGEKLFTRANTLSDTVFVCTRYGNIVNSTGSLVYLFNRQYKENNKTLKITHPSMSRFLYTIENGISIVDFAIKEGIGGEIYSMKAPSYNIMNFAKAMYPDSKQTIVGFRPGEKIAEVLISKEEMTRTVFNEPYFVIFPYPSIHGTPELLLDIDECEQYSSDNERMLSIEEIRNVLKSEGAI